MMGDISPEEREAQAEQDALPENCGGDAVPAQRGRRESWPVVTAGQPLSKATVWQRLFVFSAGALMNFLLGFVLLVIIVSMQTGVSTKIIYSFTDNALSAQTGLQAKDEILKVNGHVCFVADDIIYELQRTPNYTADFTVLRDGRTVELKNVQFGTNTAEDGTKTMVLEFNVYGLAKTPRSVLVGAVNYTLYYARAIVRSFVDLLTGRVSVNDLSGPVGIVSAIGQAVKDGIVNVLSLAAMITINLGIFNLLPLPALDGGRILFLLIEGVRGKPVSDKIQIAFNATGMALLMLLMVFVTFHDFTRMF